MWPLFARARPAHRQWRQRTVPSMPTRGNVPTKRGRPALARRAPAASPGSSVRPGRSPPRPLASTMRSPSCGTASRTRSPRSMRRRSTWPGAARRAERAQQLLGEVVVRLDKHLVHDREQRRRAMAPQHQRRHRSDAGAHALVDGDAALAQHRARDGRRRSAASRSAGARTIVRAATRPSKVKSLRAGSRLIVSSVVYDVITLPKTCTASEGGSTRMRAGAPGAVGTRWNSTVPWSSESALVPAA